MANSLAEIYSQTLIKVESCKFGPPEISKQQEAKKLNNDLVASISAPQFKHQTIASNEDIEEIRRLLMIERSLQSEDGSEYRFYGPDFERMMKDDWLVTRFLLRGRKASEKMGASTSCLSSACVYQKTMDLIRLCAKFRFDYKINAETRESEFPIEWTKQNGLFNYKPDLAGNPVIYLRISLHKPKLIGTREARHEFKRLLLYNLEKCDQDLTNNLGKGICCVFDMSNATLENIDLELVSWMIKSSKNNSPKLVCYMIVYNLPWFFSATFKLISKTLLTNSNKASLKFVYGQEILNYIASNNLPDYMRETLAQKD